MMAHAIRGFVVAMPEGIYFFCLFNFFRVGGVELLMWKTDTECGMSPLPHFLLFRDASVIELYFDAQLK